MSDRRIVEEEWGLFRVTPTHPHPGYYAGDFSVRSPVLGGVARDVSYAKARTR